MDRNRVERMLALGRRKRQDRLTDAEADELSALRREYLADFREGLRQQLDQVYIEQEDGSYRKLRMKTGTNDHKGDNDA